MKLVYLSNARMPTEKAHGLQIMKTCEALARAGHEVELVIPRRRNHLTADPFEYYGIRSRFPIMTLSTVDLIRFGRIGFLIQELSFALSAIFALQNDSRPVYSRDEDLLWIMSFFRRRTVIWESHVGAWNRAARSVASTAKAIVVISQGLKDFYIEQGIPRDKITVIPSAIDLDDFAHPESKDASRRRLGLPVDAKIALYIGRLDGWKGSGTFLEASEHVDASIRFAVIGGSSAEIAPFASRYPLVAFLGSRPYTELPDNQSAADVLVVPNTGKDLISVRFTSPLKVVAHMASGRPIVASDLPSIRELLADDAALLVPPDDPEAFARAIEKVIADPVLAGKLAARAQEKVALHTWQMRADAIVRILEAA